VSLVIAIQREQTLLGEKPEYGPSAESAAVSAARLVMATDQNGRLGISTDAAGVAIMGYDPVSYFTKGEPEYGSAKFAAIWHDALWLFADSEHQSAFLADPEKYAPAFGGFCAYCAALGHKVHADPREWVIRDGKLYMHESENVRTTWLKQPEQYIAEAANAWQTLQLKTLDPAASSPATENIAQALKLLR
jgi:YHS domain-containing protein